MDKLTSEFKRLQKLVHPDKQFAHRKDKAEEEAAGGSACPPAGLKGSIDDYIKSNLESTTVNHAYQVTFVIFPKHFALLIHACVVFTDLEKSSRACQAYCTYDAFNYLLRIF